MRCFRRCHDDGCRSTVVVGADSPTLPEDHVHQAFERLQRGAPIVMAPADDGGFVLLGLRRPLADLFRDVPWGGARVSAVMRERAAARGLMLVELPPWYDIDDHQALRRLQRELLQADRVSRAPLTASWLRALDGTAGSVI